jgi:hypothetical protein
LQKLEGTGPLDLMEVISTTAAAMLATYLVQMVDVDLLQAQCVMIAKILKLIEKVTPWNLDKDLAQTNCTVES